MNWSPDIDRMPLILVPAELASRRDAAQCISTRVNKPENDDPSIVEPIERSTTR
jgi:hypothetical protein